MRERRDARNAPVEGPFYGAEEDEYLKRVCEGHAEAGAEDNDGIGEREGTGVAGDEIGKVEAQWIAAGLDAAHVGAYGGDEEGYPEEGKEALYAHRVNTQRDEGRRVVSRRMRNSLAFEEALVMSKAEVRGTKAMADLSFLEQRERRGFDRYSVPALVEIRARGETAVFVT